MNADFKRFVACLLVTCGIASGWVWHWPADRNKYLEEARKAEDDKLVGRAFMVNVQWQGKLPDDLRREVVVAEAKARARDQAQAEASRKEKEIEASNPE